MFKSEFSCSCLSVSIVAGQLPSCTRKEGSEGVDPCTHRLVSRENDAVRLTRLGCCRQACLASYHLIKSLPVRALVSTSSPFFLLSYPYSSVSRNESVLAPTFVVLSPLPLLLLLPAAAPATAFSTPLPLVLSSSLFFFSQQE
jgi:hypothetical protein